jgi:hypothetical protein
MEMTPTASATTWDFFFLQVRLTSISTKVLPTCPVPFVTDMPVRSGPSRTRALALRRYFPLSSASAAFGSSTCEEDITFAAFNSRPGDFDSMNYHAIVGGRNSANKSS